MTFLKSIKSKIDGTNKFTLALFDGLKTEVSIIFRKPHRISLCVPTQTWCTMGCVFCHVNTERFSQKRRNLNTFEICAIVNMVISTLSEEDKNRKELLISFMGVGEPLENIENIVESCKILDDTYSTDYLMKYSISTMGPNQAVSKIQYFNKQLADFHTKVHYSIHTTDFHKRKTLIPQGSCPETILKELQNLQKSGECEVELHYTLIKGLNDTLEEMEELASYGLPVSFLKLASSANFESVDNESTDLLLRDIFDSKGVKFECYEPPGSDIGASCGQINVSDWES